MDNERLDPKQLSAAIFTYMFSIPTQEVKEYDPDEHDDDEDPT